MNCAENWSVALTVYYWNWTMFAHIYKKEMGKSKRAVA